MTQPGSLREFAVAELQNDVIIGALNLRERGALLIDACRNGQYDMIGIQLSHIDRTLHDLRNACMALERRSP